MTTLETTAILEQIGRMQRKLAELKASLSERWEQETVPKGEFEIFVCQAREERYGLMIDRIEEVLPMCKPADYPQGPPWFAGLLNLRGEMIPVVDVSGRIDHCRRPISSSDFIVVVRVAGKRYGLVFQKVFQVETISDAAVQPPMQDVPEALYVLGIVQTDHSAVFLLSLSSLLGTSELPEELQ